MGHFVPADKLLLCSGAYSRCGEDGNDFAHSQNSGKPIDGQTKKGEAIAK